MSDRHQCVPDELEDIYAAEAITLQELSTARLQLALDEAAQDDVGAALGRAIIDAQEATVAALRAQVGGLLRGACAKCLNAQTCGASMVRGHYPGDEELDHLAQNVM